MKDAEIITSMERYGGSFVTLLAELYMRGDENNRARLKAAFPELWRKYADMVALETVVRPRE